MLLRKESRRCILSAGTSAQPPGERVGEGGGGGRGVTYIWAVLGLVETQLGVALDGKELGVVAELVRQGAVAEDLPHCKAQGMGVNTFSLYSDRPLQDVGAARHTQAIVEVCQAPLPVSESTKDAINALPCLSHELHNRRKGALAHTAHAKGPDVAGLSVDAVGHEGLGGHPAHRQHAALALLHIVGLRRGQARKTHIRNLGQREACIVFVRDAITW